MSRPVAITDVALRAARGRRRRRVPRRGRTRRSRAASPRNYGCTGCRPSARGSSPMATGRIRGRGARECQRLGDRVPERHVRDGADRARGPPRRHRHDRRTELPRSRIAGPSHEAARTANAKAKAHERAGIDVGGATSAPKRYERAARSTTTGRASDFRGSSGSATVETAGPSATSETVGPRLARRDGR